MKIVKSIIKKLKEIMLTTLTVFLVCIVILGGILWSYSPGKPQPYLDETGKVLAGSLSEKIFVSIGGVKQGMFIKSKDFTQPVLL